jgi:nucleoside-diphosphate-sugar epimerase
MERTGLIGHTGFVGGTLLRQRSFDDVFRSTTIESIRGRRYGLLVCAGAPGVKWKANQDPAADRASVQLLTSCLDAVEAAHVIVVSTVDVYPEPRGVDEDSPIDEACLQAYGLHRRELERFVAGRFPCTIVRLPALFGPGLRKNVLFDLIHAQRLDRLNPASRFQFYDLEHLWSDLDRARGLGVGVLNIATEPITVDEIARDFFGLELPVSAGCDPAVHYDVRSIHAGRLKGDGGYLYSRQQVLRELGGFLRDARNPG